MTDTVQVAIIASIPPTIVGVLNYVQQRRVKADVHEVKEQTNHIKDALVATTKIAAHAKGVQDEKIRVAIKENRPLDTVVSGAKISLLMVLTGILGALLEHMMKL